MHKLNRNLAVLAAAALLGLAGCASSGGGNSYLDDAMVTARVVTALYQEPNLKVTDMNVTTEGHVVSLGGSVKTQRERGRAAEVARKVEGVKRVKNDLKVQ